MTVLLHLDSAANTGPESISRALTTMFAEAWRSRHDGAGYRARDLAVDPVPPIDAAFARLGRRCERHGLPPLGRVSEFVETDAEARTWAVSRPLIEELSTADTVLIGAPMYNYSIPGTLKTWIDRVTFPGGFLDPITGESRLADTQVVVVSPRGGAYGPDTGRADHDFLTPYLRWYFTRFGVPDRNIHLVTAERTIAGILPHQAHLRPAATESLAAARMRIEALAAREGTGAVSRT